MPDWNEPIEEGRGLFRKARPQASSGKTEPTSAADGQTDQDWKLNRSTSGNSGPLSTPSGNSWTTPEDDGELGISGTQVARLTWVAGLVAVSAILAGVFIYVVFLTPRRLPLVHVVMGDYGAATIGRNPFDATEREIWGPVNSQIFGDGIEILSIGRDQSGESAARLLTEIAVNQDGLIRSIPKKQRFVPGGGPSGNVRMWIISALAADMGGVDGELRLLRADRSEIPGTLSTTESQASQGVPLRRVLRQIAEATPSNEISVVLLDLRSPPVIMDFHHLAPAWESLLIKSLDAESPATDRLLVGIAAGDNQINWAAHELGAGVFTYFIEQALRGNSDLNRDGHVTWAELTTYLTDEVQRWAARRRNSVQTPRWVIPPALRNTSPALRLFAVSKAQAPPHIRLDKAFLEKQIAQLDSLWRTHAELRAYRDAPEQWGLIESNLILLQEMLERKSVTNWAILVRQVEESFADLQRRRDEAPATSLHERQPVVQRMTAEVHNRWNEKLQETLHPSDSTATEQPLPTISDDQLAWLCWTRAIGRQPQPSNEDKAIYQTQVTRLDRETLAGLLDFYQQHRTATTTKNEVRWQELHLLTLLDSEVDWAGAELQSLKRDAEETALDLCQSFDLIMEISGRYGPECHRWTDADLQELEFEFLTALDELFAGKTSDAKNRVSSLRPQLSALKSRADELNAYLNLHTDAQYQLGHLLAWILQGYLVADEGDLGTYEDKLRSWRRVLELTDQCSQLRNAPRTHLPPDHPLLITGRELADELDRLHRDWNQFVDRLANPVRSEDSENNFRWLQIALKNPLTEYQQRSMLYDKMVQFLDQPISEKLTGNRLMATDTTPGRSGRSVADAYEILWSRQLEPRGEFDILRQLYSGKLADLSGADGNHASARDRAAGKLTYYRESIYRQAALAMGHRFGPDQRETVRLELNQLRDEADCRYWEAQGKRIVRMGLGDGFQPVAVAQLNPYFHGAANAYLQAIQRTLQRNRAAHSVAAAAETNLHAQMNSELQYLREIRLLWGDPSSQTFEPGQKQKPETIRITANAKNDSPPLMAALYMRSDRESDSRIAFLAGRHDSRVIPLTLGPGSEGPAVQRDVRIDTQSFRDHSSSPIFGTLAFRGHHYISELKYREVGQDLPVHEISFVPSTKGPTRLVVDASPRPPVLNMMVLIDCSGSMAKQVQVGGGPMQLMEAAKYEAIELLKRLDELDHENSVHVNMGLIPFGVGGQDNWHGDDIVKHRETLDGQRLSLQGPREEIVQTDLRRISQNSWKADLTDFIQSQLKPSGNTPLYLAIDRAFTQLGLRGRQGIQHVVVISDGVNYFEQSDFSFAGLVKKLTDEHGFGPGKNPLADISRRLTILMFDNPPTNERERRAHQQGMNELRNLSQRLPKQYTFFSTRDFAQFRQEIRNLIPPTRVVVSRSADQTELLAEGMLKESLELNLDGPGPTHLAVEVDGFLVQASAPSKIPVYHGDQVKLTLSPNQQRIEWMGWKNARPASQTWEDHLFTLAEPRRDPTGRRVDFLIDYEPSTATSFETRPAELLCRVQRFRASTQNAGAFNIWDHDFEYIAGKHFPLLRLAQLPWFDVEFPGTGNKADTQSLDARVTLWVKKTELPPATLIEIKPGEEQTTEIGETTFRISHRADRVTVVARSPVPQDQRRNRDAGSPGTQGCFDWIVRSSSARDATRRFAVDGSHAEHTLYLSDEAVGQRQVSVELRSFRESIPAMDAELTFPLRATPF